MVEANVDKIMQALNEKNTISINELSKKLSLPKDDVQKSVEYLEEDGVVKIEHKFPGTVVTLIKKQDTVKEIPPPPPIQEPKPIQQPEQSTVQPVQTPQLPPPPQKDNIQTLQPPPKKEEEIPMPPLPPKNLKEDTKADIKPPPDLPKPPENKEEKPKLEQPKVEQPPSQTLQSPFEKKAEKPFLMEEQKKEEPKIITPTQVENMKASLDIMKPSPVDTLQNQKPEKFDLENNPLNEGKPKFEMKTPSPMDYPVFPSMGAPAEMKTNMDTQVNVSQSDFPAHVESELDKIEYLLDKLEGQLNNHNYKDINTLYRQIYEKYNNSYDLSINERTLVNDRIQQIYQRIKRAYIIEGVT